MTTISVTLHQKPDGDIILLSHNPKSAEEVALASHVIRTVNCHDQLVQSILDLIAIMPPNHATQLVSDIKKNVLGIP